MSKISTFARTRLFSGKSIRHQSPAMCVGLREHIPQVQTGLDGVWEEGRSLLTADPRLAETHTLTPQ